MSEIPVRVAKNRHPASCMLTILRCASDAAKYFSALCENQGLNATRRKTQKSSIGSSFFVMAERSFHANLWKSSFHLDKIALFAKMC